MRLFPNKKDWFGKNIFKIDLVFPLFKTGAIIKTFVALIRVLKTDQYVLHMNIERILFNLEPKLSKNCSFP